MMMLRLRFRLKEQIKAKFKNKNHFMVKLHLHANGKSMKRCFCSGAFFHLQFKGIRTLSSLRMMIGKQLRISYLDALNSSVWRDGCLFNKSKVTNHHGQLRKLIYWRELLNVLRKSKRKRLESTTRNPKNGLVLLKSSTSWWDLNRTESPDSVVSVGLMLLTLT